MRNIATVAKGCVRKGSSLNPIVSDEVLIEEGITHIHSVTELYSNNQFVSLHIPATPQTKNSVNKALVELMPKKGVLINTARKEIIDEASLLEALKDRADLMYISDIKPDNAATFLVEAPGRVFFTPKKMGAQTSEANINAGIAAAKHVVAFLKDGWNNFQVTNYSYS